jgi:hypothetical protein
MAILLALLAPLVVIFVTVAATTSRQRPSDTQEAGFLPAPRPAHAAEIVHVGIQPIGFDSVSLQSGTFEASFYMWWRWRGSIDPTTSTIILNSSSASAANYTVQYTVVNAHGVETPEHLPDGDLYQAAKVSVGVSDPFSISRYPLDNQTLSITIESNTWDADTVAYVPDLANMRNEPSVPVVGWNVGKAALVAEYHHYSTNFGTPNPTTDISVYSDLEYQVPISRPFSHFLMKLFLPMFIVLLAGLSSLFVKTDDFDVRLAMAGTGLLTLIFLQQGYAGDLPETAPVVLMDKIYALAYAAVGLTFLRVVYTTARLHHHRADPHVYATTDHVLAVTLAVVFILGATLLVSV